MALELTTVPVPDFIEAIDYDAILARLNARLVALDSEYTSIVDGDPAYAVQQAVAYEVAMLRQRINDAGKANLVTSAIGADLDNLGANVNTYRRVLQYADDTVDPPLEEKLESDVSYRERVISAVDSLALGSIGWYRKYALASSQNVLDAAPRGKIKTIALDATSQSSAVWQFSTVATQALVNGLSGRKFAIITVSGEKYLAFASGLSDSGGNLSSLKVGSHLAILTATGNQIASYRLLSTYDSANKRFKIGAGETGVPAVDSDNNAIDYAIALQVHFAGDGVVFLQATEAASLTGQTHIPTNTDIMALNTYLNQEAYLFICDTVTVAPVALQQFDVSLRFTPVPGISSATARATLQSKAETFLKSKERIGDRVMLADFYAALATPQVQELTIVQPDDNIIANTGLEVVPVYPPEVPVARTPYTIQL